MHIAMQPRFLQFDRSKCHMLLSIGQGLVTALPLETQQQRAVTAAI